MRRRSEEASAAMHETKVAREALAKQTIEARLQLMEAQVEPHFLFNSLANVQRLYETDPEAGQHLLDNLKIYLHGALAQMRDAGATVGREADLASAYLEVLRARMGERLQFLLDVPQDLRDRPFPPMMLITLVENAVKHGIHRSPTGGVIAVRARRDAERLCVEVADTGPGFQSLSGKGIGLANIRARLHALFGDRAHLSLGANAPSGVVASIVVPIP
jgi:LytS/YehU family sensor histidine kinase